MSKPKTHFLGSSGSSVEVDPSARLRCDIDKIPHQVWLDSGKGRFDLVASPADPWLVSSPLINVRVVTDAQFTMWVDEVTVDYGLLDVDHVEARQASVWRV